MHHCNWHRPALRCRPTSARHSPCRSCTRTAWVSCGARRSALASLVSTWRCEMAKPLRSSRLNVSRSLLSALAAQVTSLNRHAVHSLPVPAINKESRHQFCPSASVQTGNRAAFARLPTSADLKASSLPKCYSKPAVGRVCVEGKICPRQSGNTDPSIPDRFLCFRCCVAI